MRTIRAKLAIGAAMLVPAFTGVALSMHTTAASTTKCRAVLEAIADIKAGQTTEAVSDLIPFRNDINVNGAIEDLLELNVFGALEDLSLVC